LIDNQECQGPAPHAADHPGSLVSGRIVFEAVAPTQTGGAHLTLSPGPPVWAGTDAATSEPRPVPRPQAWASAGYFRWCPGETILPMMISNTYLMIFAMAMTGCVLATPLVTWLATWVGAIDRPDQFRRIHKGAVPRLGGLALALGVAAGTVLTQLHDPLRQRAVGEFGAHLHWSLLVAALIILLVGFIDDTRSLSPRVKLLGQALAVLTLYLGASGSRRSTSWA